MTALGSEFRFEVKYVAQSTLLPDLLAWLLMHPANLREVYAKRTINNVYFDNHYFTAYRDSIEGISQRTKVRYRWYGDDEPFAPGRLEVKRRRGRTSVKSAWEAKELIGSPDLRWTELLRALRALLPVSARLWLEAFPCPTLINRYRRSYWSTPDGGARVTVDWGHTVYDQRYNPYPNLTRQANLPDGLIIELKLTPEHRAFAEAITQSLPLRPRRNSKYCTGVGALNGY